MNETEIRVNAMIAEYRNAVGAAAAVLADRCALLAAELATVQAKLNTMGEENKNLKETINKMIPKAKAE